MAAVSTTTPRGTPGTDPVTAEPPQTGHALVIGASRGLGEAVARHLAATGWQVTIGARSADRLHAIAAELTAAGGQVHAVTVDVADADSVAHLFTAATERFGVPLGLVHLAARYGPFGAVSSVAAAEWERTIATNVTGTFTVLRHAARVMGPVGRGRIIVLSGGGATAPQPTLSAYAASKAAVVRLVETFAREVAGSGLAVNAIAPGLLATDMLDELLAAGPEVVDAAFYQRMVTAKATGEDRTPDAVAAIDFLLRTDIPGLTGRLIAAVWDPWRQWQADPSALADPDAFTLRRQVPGP